MKKVLFANNLSGAFEIVITQIIQEFYMHLHGGFKHHSLSSGGEGSDLWKVLIVVKPGEN